jgi:DNA-binding transcriptional LysR family regulator
MEEQKINTLWTHLHWLSVLAQQGSYTAAAARLGVSKAAMSQRIAELERAAKVTLVQRTTRSLRLTEAGQKLVDDTRASFEQIEQSFAQVRDLAEQPSGLIRMTAPVALARQQLVPLLADFLKAHPEVRIELDMSDRLTALATEGFDLAIRHTARPPDTHVAWALCTTETVLVATRAYLRKQGEPQTPSDLQTHNCLHYPRSQDTPAWTFEPRQLLRGDDRITVPVMGQQQRGAARSGPGRRGHCPAARLQRPSRLAPGQAGSGAARLETCGRVCRNHLRHPALCAPRAPSGDRPGGCFAPGFGRGFSGLISVRPAPETTCAARRPSLPRPVPPESNPSAGS